MPIIKSAKKRVRVAAKARARNLHTKRNMRRALKDYAAALEGGKAAEVAKAQAAAISALDMATKKAIIHKNKAARHKSRLASLAKSAGIKVGATAAKKKSTSTTPKKSAAQKVKPV